MLRAMRNSTRAMASWFGVLLGEGQLRGERDEQGMMLAVRVVGEESMREVQEWITSTSLSERAGEVAASFEVCIWMITANGRLSEEERELFEDILSQAELPEEEHGRLNEALVDPPSLQDIEGRLTQPVLRELALGMCWEFARIDGSVERSEEAFFLGLSRRLEITPERAGEIRDAVETRSTIYGF